MEDLPTSTSQRYRRSLGGRLFSGAATGGLLGAGVAAKMSPSIPDVVLWTLTSGTFGVLAAALLEWRDRRRKKTAEWKRRVAATASQIRTNRPDLSAAKVQIYAQTHEEQKLTPLVWTLMAIGGFSLLCGAAMLVTRIAEFFSAR